MAESTKKRPVALLLIGAGVIVLAVVVALTTTSTGTNTGERFDLADYDEPGVAGDPLPQLQDPASDPAIGRAAPSIAGESLDHEPVNLQPEQDGPAVVLFLAHWCPSCQREVPVVRDLVEAGGVPAGVRLVAVATGIDENAPNYPPNLWLEGEEWNVPTIVDTDGSLAQAYGLSAFPFWALIDEAGNIAARFSGQLGEDQLRSVLEQLAAEG